MPRPQIPCSLPSKVFTEFPHAHLTVRKDGVAVDPFDGHRADGTCGASDAPLLVFVHGWPELSISWRHQLPVFAALGFRCVAPDMRGYGRSSTYTRHEEFAQALIVDAMLELLA